MTPARPPSTPPRRPAALARGLSPPVSPSTTHTTDDHLGSSYLFVHEDDTSSEIGSSLRGSVIGELSDSSSDLPGREGWEDESASGDHHSDDIVQVESPIDPDQGELGGSYIDAEATASTLSGSRDTVHRHLAELSDSQVRLIMPDPSSSFTSATFSSETTPSASLGNLLSVSDESGKPTSLRRDTSSTIRPIDRSWLENSTKLWNVPSELKERIDAQEESAYSLLSSTEEIASPFIEEEPKEKVSQTKARKPSLQPLLPMTITKDRVLPGGRRLSAARLHGLPELSKKWSVRVSVLALASLLSIGLLGSVGKLPGTSLDRKNPAVDNSASAASSPLPSASRTSIWEHFAVSPVLLTTSTSSVVATPSSTGKIPDLQLIKQALSTLSTTFNVVAPVDPDITPSTWKYSEEEDDETRTKSKSRRRRTSVNVSCCAVSVRDTNTGLSVRPTQYSLITTDTSWKSSIARKLRRSSANDSTPNATHATPCSCELSEHLGMAFTTSVLRGISFTRHQSSLLAQYLGTVYAPAMLELQREWQELLALLRTMSEASSTLTQFIIRRAARGISISRKALDATSTTLRANMPEIHKPQVDPETIAKAKAKAKVLSEYVESQAVSMAEYLEEQTTAIQEKSVESLKQAKRGLDRLVVEARKVINDDLAEFSTFSLKGKLESKRGRPARNRSRKSTEAKSRGAKERRRATRIPPPEKPSKGRKLLDMIHHGAMALVL